MDLTYAVPTYFPDTLCLPLPFEKPRASYFQPPPLTARSFSTFFFLFLFSNANSFVLDFARSLIRFLIRKKEKKKKKERKKKEKCARYPTPTLGSKKLIGYAIFDRRAGYGRGRGGKGPPLLTRVVNGVASACVTIGN